MQLKSGPLIYQPVQYSTGGVGVITRMKQYEIISEYRKGTSFRKIASMLGVDRKTVAKICHEYDQHTKDILSNDDDKKRDIVTEKLVEKRRYSTSKRQPRVFTKEIQQRMQDFWDEEVLKTERLGKHKQALSAKQVHLRLITEGFSISYRTVATYWKKFKESYKPAYIKQTYSLGERVEFDFGELKLWINGKSQTVYLSVWASPASGFFWAYLHRNQSMEAFRSSHVQFFEQIQGVYREVVYDNMRNVVSKFIGRNEKILNESLVKLSLYYGFNVHVTNCFSGHEKGTVEKRVSVIRKQCFAERYIFNDLEEAQCYLQQMLTQLNQQTNFEEEREHLLAYRPPYEIAQYISAKVSKFSTVTVDSNQYSVPDYLVGQSVQLKVYSEEFVVYSHHTEVCRHQKIEGKNQSVLKIEHFLSTLKKKPNALKHSVLLAQSPDLNNLYTTYYSGYEREFLSLLEETVDLSESDRHQRLVRVGREKWKETSTPLDWVSSSTKEGILSLNTLYGFEEVH